MLLSLNCDLHAFNFVQVKSQENHHERQGGKAYLDAYMFVFSECMTFQLQCCRQDISISQWEEMREKIIYFCFPLTKLGKQT